MFGFRVIPQVELDDSLENIKYRARNSMDFENKRKTPQSSGQIKKNSINSV